MHVKLKDAATIILLRNSPDPLVTGFEVLMVLRSPVSKFLPGLYVFPGGGVEEADCLPETEALCAGMDRERATSIMDDISSPENALGAWTAGIRETFEEVGLLLAYKKDGSVVSLDSEEPLRDRLASHRRLLHEGKTDFYDIMRSERLILAADRLHYFSHWITPEPSPIRYDVRFFVAEAPPDQEALHDDIELTRYIWITPENALKKFHEEAFGMVLPTFITMEELSGYKTIEEVIRSTEGKKVQTTLTRVIIDKDETMVEYAPDGRAFKVDPYTKK